MKDLLTATKLVETKMEPKRSKYAISYYGQQESKKTTTTTTKKHITVGLNKNSFITEK